MVNKMKVKRSDSMKNDNHSSSLSIYSSLVGGFYKKIEDFNFSYDFAENCISSVDLYELLEIGPNSNSPRLDQFSVTLHRKYLFASY